MAILQVNGESLEHDAAPDTPLLWVLRDYLGLTGTKFGCGIAACGACTVLVDGNPVRSCVMPVSALGDGAITTIEGLADGTEPHRVQQAWIDHQVPQCGYCQSGMILASVALLQQNPSPSDEDIAAVVSNVCRCGTYSRVKRAIKSLAQVPSGT